MDTTNSDTITNYNIYCLTKNNILNEVANIVEIDENIIINPILNPNILHLNAYLDELYKCMLDIDKNLFFEDIIHTSRYQFPNNEYIRGIIFHRVYMRKGTYYYVIQQSDRGFRILLYAINRVHHQSIAFGCHMKIPNITTELNEMKTKLIELFIDKHNNFFDKMNLCEIRNIITNNALYFL